MMLLAVFAPWAAKAQETLTVCDETTGTLTNNAYVPMYGNYFDTYTKSEFVIPADQLSDMDGGTITSLKFYIQTVGKYGSGWNSNQQVFLKEVSSTSLSAFSGTDDATIVWEGSFTVPSSSDTEFEITFTTPYEYQGGNLLVGIYNTTTIGGYRNVAWYGQTVNGASGSGNSSSSLSGVSFSQKNFIPKTTFTYEAAASDCPKPNNLVASNVTAHTADLSWESDGFEFILQYKKASQSSWNEESLYPDDMPYMLTNLAAETEYQVRVAAILNTCPTDPETGDPIPSDWREISFTTGIACFAPTNLAVTAESITEYGATITWTAGGDETNWQIEFATDADFTNPLYETVEGEPTYTFHGLDDLTTYYVHVQAVCGGSDGSSEYCAPVSFTTLQAAANLPYSNDFESENGWLFVNGNLTNAWAYGTATNNGGTHALYISNDGGTTNAYNINSAAMVYATKLFNFEAGTYVFSYDWIANGENRSDYLRVALVPSSVILTAGTSAPSVPSGYFYNNLPTGWIALDGGGKLNLKTDWQSYVSTEIEIATAGSYMMVFAWRDDTMVETNPPAAIDNVSIEMITCSAPTDLTVNESATTATSVELSWTENGEATAWQIELTDEEDNVEIIGADSNPFTLTELTPESMYAAKVRAYCDEDNQSDWSKEVSFATKCEAIVVDAANPFTEDFEGDWTPLCWKSIPYIDGTTTHQWTKTTDISYIHTGAVAAFSSFYGPIYLVMPALQLGTDGNAAQLTFWSYNSYVDDYDKNSIVLLDGENEIELWSPESVVQSWKEVTIDLTAYIGHTISLAFKYEGNNADGWYVDDVEVTMTKTFTKTIEAHGTGEKTSGWYLIASPIGDVDATAVANLANADDNEGFDLYRFNEAAELEWENWKSLTNNEDHYHFNLEAGRGYLYANANDVTLTFTGTPYTGSGEVTLSYSEENPDENMWGWNLIGNPWSVPATIGDRPYYRMNYNENDGNQVGGKEIIQGEGSIAPMEGIFVKAESNGETVTFSPATTSAPSAPMMAINILQEAQRGASKTIDRAVVRFGEGNTLSKFQLNPNHTKVYIPQDGKDYAVVNAGNIGEIPVCFNAENDGRYTMSFNAKEVTFSYLHLIDNMTGTDIDLLATPSYSFDARTTDYSSRFKLVFATGSNNDSDNFAFFSNGNIIVNGEGTLQMIDMTGRVIVQGDAINRVSTDGMTAGVYVLRLINGDNIKVQKIVVR